MGLVNLKDFPCQGDITVLLEDLHGNWDELGWHMLCRTMYSLPFNAPEITTEDVLGSIDVTTVDGTVWKQIPVHDVLVLVHTWLSNEGLQYSSHHGAGVIMVVISFLVISNSID